MTWILAIKDDGIIAFTILDHNLKVDDYLEFLHKIKLETDKDYIEKVAVFYDGLAVHTSRAATSLIRDWKWIGILNVAYRYQYNPVQYAFAMIKGAYFNSNLTSKLNPIFDPEGRIDKLKIIGNVENAYYKYKKYNFTSFIAQSRGEMIRDLDINL